MGIYMVPDTDSPEVMQYASIGFAFSFFLIPLILSLMIPLDGLHQDSGQVGDWINRELSGSYSPNSPISEDDRLSYPWLWTTVLEKIESVKIPFRDQLHGYRRITAQNILDHETRRKIYELIRQHPGIGLSALAELSGCNENTLRYHLNRIADERWITIFDKGRSSHFFENHQRFNPEELQFLSFYSYGLSGRILQFIHAYPGITRKELADRLGVASPTVTRAVGTLTEKGYVLLVKKGRCTLHFLPANFLPLIPA